MKTIYLVVKVDKVSATIIYVFGAFTEIKIAQGYCDQLNEMSKKVNGETFIVERTTLNAI